MHCTAGDGNLIPNGSFECGPSGWGSQTANYITWATPMDRLFGEVVEAEAFHGKRCLKIAINPQNQPVVNFDCYQPLRVPVKAPLAGNIGYIQVEPGQQHVLSAYLRADQDGTPARLGVQQFGEWGNSTKVQVGREWKQYTFKFKPKRELCYVLVGPDLLDYSDEYPVPRGQYPEPGTQYPEPEPRPRTQTQYPEPGTQYPEKQVPTLSWTLGTGFWVLGTLVFPGYWVLGTVVGRMMDRYGGRKPLWLTEHGYYADDDLNVMPPDRSRFPEVMASERQQAEFSMRFNLILLANGVQKIFYHAGTAEPLNRDQVQGIFFRYGGQPRKIYPALAAMAGLFTPQVKFLKDMSPAGRHQRALMFQDGNRLILAAWQPFPDKPGTVTTSRPQARVGRLKVTGAAIEIRDLMGNPISGREVNLSSSPVFVVAEELSPADLEKAVRIGAE